MKRKFSFFTIHYSLFLSNLAFSVFSFLGENFWQVWYNRQKQKWKVTFSMEKIKIGIVGLGASGQGAP